MAILKGITGNMNLAVPCTQRAELYPFSLKVGVKNILITIQPLLKPGFSGEGRIAIPSQERLGIWQTSAQIALKCLSCSTGTAMRAYTPVT